MGAKPENRSAKISPIYVVCGPEQFLKQQAIGGIADRTLAGADRSLALSEYDGASPTLALAEVLDELRTLPFLAQRRLVMVRDADTFVTRFREQLEDYAGSPCPTGVLLIECKSLAANTRLYKAVQAAGQVIKCEAIKRNKLPEWAASRCSQAYGVRLNSQAASLLCELVGDDLGLIDGELQKLSLYVAGRGQITAADVEALVGQQREEKVWGIVSAIAVGDEAKALSLWEDVWQTDRAAPGRAVAGVAFTVRRLLAAKRAQEAGVAMRELCAMLMQWNNEPQVRTELAAFSVAQLEGMLCTLLDADVAAKTGGASVQSSIEAFIVELCRQVKPVRRPARRATG